ILIRGAPLVRADRLVRPWCNRVRGPNPMAITVAALASQVQVNIPFPYLLRGYLERFLELGLNPEIGLDAYSLSRYPPRVFRQAARAFQAASRRITLHAPFQDL